jgi:hypothetical protein
MTPPAEGRGEAGRGEACRDDRVSYWLASTSREGPARSALPDRADVVVVGAGIVGLTAAYLPGDEPAAASTACCGRRPVGHDAGAVAVDAVAGEAGNHELPTFAVPGAGLHDDRLGHRMKAMVGMEDPPVVGRGNGCGRNGDENRSDDCGQQQPLASSRGRAGCARLANTRALEDVAPVVCEPLARGEVIKDRCD